MEERICKKMSFNQEWKRGVIDDDSGDEGNDELICVRSDEMISLRD